MNKKHYGSTAKFFEVLTIGLVILALQINTVKAQVSFITNGQSIQATNSWDIKLVDINGDGHLDAYFGSKTWLNNGNGNISETDLSFGSGIFASFGDLNGDGFVDVVCQDSIYLNDGDNHYEFKIKLSSDILMYSSVLVDVDNDEDIDIISCSQTTDRILINDGKGNFTNTGNSLGGWGQASYTFGDINSDGFTDIYVAIPHTPPPAMKHSSNKIWFGSAEKKFTERSHDIVDAVSRNAILCDFDNDSDLDLFLASNGNSGNMIFFNDGKGNFKDSGQKLGNNSGSASTADFDGDGNFDLLICYGEVPFGDGAPNRVWYNDGKGHFTDSKLSLGNSNSAAIGLGDMNKDGKIDAVIVNVKLDPKNGYASVPCPLEIWLNNAFESNNWSYNKDPESDGWNSKKMEEFNRYIIDSTHITGFLIIHKKQIVFDYGNIEENSYIASCRKSVLSMLFGKYVENGVINLDETLNELGIQDVKEMLPIEKEATIKDLISARSGIYLTGSNGGDFRDFAPERGTKEPGAYWLYSNYDFNLAGYIFEKESGKNIYDDVEDQLAIPLGMQDWDRSLQQKYEDTTISIFPAYHMWFSTRDMARIGLLMLNKGKWNEKQVISEEWVNEMLTLRTTSEEMIANVPILEDLFSHYGYGYMWWLFENPTDDRFKNAYSALGAMGQCISVFPEIDVVIAYKTNSVYGKSNSARITQLLLMNAIKIYEPK